MLLVVTIKIFNCNEDGLDGLVLVSLVTTLDSLALAFLTLTSLTLASLTLASLALILFESRP